MEFYNELRNKSNEVATAFAMEYMEKIKPILLAEASKGYLSYVDRITTIEEESNLHLYCHPRFTEALMEVLKETKVEVTQSDFNMKVYFYWGDKALEKKYLKESIKERS